MPLLGSNEKKLKRNIEMLTGPDPEKRSRAAQEISEIGGPRALSQLKRALGDRDKSVRWKVAYALGEMGTDEAYIALRDHLKVEEDWNVRRIIVMSFRHWDRRAVEPLLKALGDSSEYVRKYAAMTLGFNRSKEAETPLKELLKREKSRDVRDYAKWALKEIEGQR